VTELTDTEQAVYRCKTCEVRFSVPSHETVVCCPVCRMNRIKAIE